MNAPKVNPSDTAQKKFFMNMAISKEAIVKSISRRLCCFNLMNSTPIYCDAPPLRAVEAQTFIRLAALRGRDDMANERLDSQLAADHLVLQTPIFLALPRDPITARRRPQ